MGVYVNSYTVLYRKAGLEEFGMIQFFTVPLLSTPLVVIKRLETITISSHFDLTDPAPDWQYQPHHVQETRQLCAQN